MVNRLIGNIMSDKLEFNKAGVKDLESQLEDYVLQMADAIKSMAKDTCNIDTSLLKESIEIYDGDNNLEKLIGVDDGTVPYALTQEVGNSVLKNIPSYQPYLRPSLITIANKVGGKIV